VKAGALSRKVNDYLQACWYFYVRGYLATFKLDR